MRMIWILFFCACLYFEHEDVDCDDDDDRDAKRKFRSIDNGYKNVY